MSLPIFYRGSLPDLWIGIRATHRLRQSGGPAVQDPDGVPGQVSLLHVPTDVRYPVPMAVWGADGQSLGGKIAFDGLPMGEYSIEGRSWDDAGDSDDFAFGFVLALGAAPENGAVALGGDSGSSATLQAGASLNFGALSGVLNFGTSAVPALLSFKP